ncbi:hypothetical protein ACM26V_03280 [Salipaludibacillus sp. HK11]|uniref:hypothetical protein n=1 Tax=Salipaludibacillus sp. HK11 TaxID=3394320 RepID=UPI0039FBCFEB
MAGKRYEEIMEIINELKKNDDKKLSKKLNLYKCERLIKRLDSFATECKKCESYLIECEQHFFQLKNTMHQLETSHIKQHNLKINQIVTHLQKGHKLVEEGTHLSIYMSIGMSLGVVFGLTLFDNIGIGIAFGISIGVAIGAGLDADAKKKGLTI